MPALARLLATLDRRRPAPTASAHCDGPCGVYDPASSRIAAEAVLSMARKLTELDASPDTPGAANTYPRFVQIKEEQAQIVKDQLAVLWSDYFKPEHLEAHPDLHTVFWMAIKAASTCKMEVSVEASLDLLDRVEAIHHMFWSTKGRDVPWVLANP